MPGKHRRSRWNRDIDYDDMCTRCVDFLWVAEDATWD